MSNARLLADLVPDGLDYEEGTWTPVSNAGTLNVVDTPTYTKTGRHVLLTAVFTMPTQTNSNQARVSGLCASGSGGNNNFFGCEAGKCNTTGFRNNFFGPGVGYDNTTGSDNNFFGHRVGRFNTTGSNNNFFGFYAGKCNTTGSNNNFFGRYAGFCNTTGS